MSLPSIIRYLVAWVRLHQTVRTSPTGDTLEAEKDLGRNPNRRWRGRLRLTSRRRLIQVSSSLFWWPDRTYSLYDITATIVNETGNSVTFPTMTFPRMGLFSILNGDAAHSAAMEAYVDTMLGLER